MFATSGMLFGQRVIDLREVWGDMRVLGDDAYDDSGFAVAYGDINGDGYRDIIIGAPFADPLGGDSAGETYVIFGSRTLPSTIDLDKVSADITICGDDEWDYSGYAVASGDVNGDGYHDIIIGAWFAKIGIRYSAGETYVIFGSSNPPSIIDLNIQSADITVFGDDEFDYSGFVVASGDVNGDNCDDVIIGAYCAEPGGRSYAGETYVIFGSNSPPSTVDLSTESADITIYGDDAYDHCGSAVASGDVNNDGYHDVIIGADGGDPSGGNQAGETYVIFGSSFTSPPYTIDLDSQSADITIYGDDYGDYSSQSVASGDVNGDGYHDIIIGAPEANYNKWYGAGKTYVIFGSSSPPTTIDLNSQLADITVYGDDDKDECGSAVASGDVNGDGYHDIIIGAPGADRQFPGLTLWEVGETYVIFGSSFPSPPYTIDLDSQSADITVYGENGGDDSGWSVASGDVTGDAYADIIIGAPWADPGGRTSAGETYLLSGGGAIITAHGFGGSGWIKEFSLLGRGWNAFKAFGPVNSQGEVHLAVGDIDVDGHDEIAAGHGEGGSSWVKLFEVNGTLIQPFKAFGAVNANGEVHLAIGNFDADLNDKEIAVAQGEGGQSWVKLFRANGTLIKSFKAFGGANAQGEVHLASGDLDKDGVDEIIAGMGEGGSSWVKIFNRLGGLIRSFQAFSSTENPGGEVHLAVGNFDADPSVEIAVATGYNGGNRVKLFEKNGTFIRQFTAFGAGGNPNGDVQITAADIDNDGMWEVICAHGEGGSSWVKMFKANGSIIRSFKAFGGVNSQGEVHLEKSNY